MRKSWLSLLATGALAAAAAGPAGSQTRGLVAAPDALGGPVWQARFERDLGALPPLRGLGHWLAPVAPQRSLRLLGDYQFSTLRLGDTGGLRLTGGLLLNLRQSASGLLVAEQLSARPYAGVGYASGSLDGRWGFSADLGLAAPGLGALPSDRPAGTPGVELQPRLLPMLRLGMTLAF